MPSLGVYIQVPFCASKCSFCNFSSQVAPSAVFDVYCDALLEEIRALPRCYLDAGIATDLPGRPVDTVYAGGGTPTLLGCERVERITEALRRSFHLEPRLEFTVEVAPGSATEPLLGRLRELGVNRLSLGAQSFDDRELGAIGRLHTAADTEDLAHRARDAGFANLNLDLIAGLPYQTGDSWRRSLERALALRPEHLSVYLFEIDEKSRLGREVIRHGTRYHAAAVPGEDFMVECYGAARAALASAGYLHYEISNFALPGYESLHNRKYWRLAPYIGLGAGAHSFDGRRRWANVAQPETYQARLAQRLSPIAEAQELSASEHLEEFLFLGLRQLEGVDLAEARARWGREQASRAEARLAEFVSEGWLVRSGDRVRLAERALLVSNEIFQELIAA